MNLVFLLWVGRDIKAPRASIPCHVHGHHTPTQAAQDLEHLQGWGATASLGSLGTLVVKDFLISVLNLPSFSLKLLPLVLPSFIKRYLKCKAKLWNTNIFHGFIHIYTHSQKCQTGSSSHVLSLVR